MWLYKSGNFGRKIALYEYQPSRSGKHAKKFLEGFHGFLQSDYSDKINIPILYLDHTETVVTTDSA